MEAFRIFLSIFIINLSKVSSECLEFPPMENFNSSFFFSGKWFVAKSFNQLIPYLDGNCALVEFTKPNEFSTSVVDDVGENRVFDFTYELQENSELKFSFNMSVPLMGVDYEADAKVSI